MSDRIYLAGPITGLKHADTIGWRQKFTALLAGTAIQCFSPMRGKDHLKLLDKIEGSYPDNILSRSRAIMTRGIFRAAARDSRTALEELKAGEQAGQ